MDNIIYRQGRALRFIAVIALLTAGSFQLVIAQSKVASIKEKVHTVSIDPLSNIYLINEELEYRLYDGEGRLAWTYSDLELSELSEISSDHPFKSMIYYPEYELIRVFGNKLQVLAELNLTSMNLGEITAIAPTAGYQSFWIFDATEQQLFRINQNYTIENDGIYLTPIINDQIFPSVIKEQDGWLYLYDKQKGLFVFDNFGTYLMKVDLLDIQSFSVLKDRIFYSRENEVYEFVKPSKASILVQKTTGRVLNMVFRTIVVEKDDSIEIQRF